MQLLKRTAIFLSYIAIVTSTRTNSSSSYDNHPNSVHNFHLAEQDIQTNQDENQVENAADEIRYRLPQNVVPERYVIHLIPDLDSGNFLLEGTVSIDLRIVGISAVHIIVHADDIEVNKDSVQIRPLDGGENVEIINQEYDPVRHFYTISVNRLLIPGERFNVYMGYTGHLRDDMRGFYRSYYYDEDTGDQRWLASTQFQATHARRAFPCFDEPGYKATFKISIARTADRHALSNMPVAESEEDIGLNLVWDHFEETPMPMSTYLIAFVVSDFESLSSSDNKFHTWYRKSASSQAQYSIDVSPATLKVLEDFTEIPYFLPKIDQVAVPDFSSGAMENWGLVTYRETNLLHETGVSTSANKQRIAEVIAHELAHKWFGNLVSPKWWRYLWLSEGFATYFQYFAMAKVEPDMRLDDQFLLLHHHTAFDTDALESAHPMTHEVGSPTEVRTLFSRISYNKAGAVIRMAEHFLGHETFRVGLKRYLTEKYNDVAEPDDLFNSLHTQYITDTSNPVINVKTVLDSWSLKKGYPVITVTRNYVTGALTVSQERFVIRREDSPEETLGYRWWVPLSYTSQSAPDFTTTSARAWLSESQTQTTIADFPVNTNEWVIFNIQQTGFYRVNYDSQNWALLIRHLNSRRFSDIHVLNRAQLLNDGFHLARAGTLDYDTAIRVANYLTQETDYIPWSAALSALSFLDGRIRTLGENQHAAFRSFVLRLLGPIYSALGFNERLYDSHTTKLLRNLVLTWECNYGNSACISNSQNNFQSLMEQPDITIAPDLKSVIFCNAIRYGGENEWDFLWERYLNESVSTEQVLILNALGCTRNEQLAHRLLWHTVSNETVVRAHDISSLFPYVLNHHYGVDLAISFLQNNYQLILGYDNYNAATLNSYISSIAGALTTRAQYNRLDQFITTISTTLGQSGTAAARNSLRAAEENFQWVAKYASLAYNSIQDSNHRLPTEIVPDHYTIRLIPNLDDGTFKFSGEVEIIFSAIDVTDKIVLHVNDLEINETSILLTTKEGSELVEVRRHYEDRDYHFYRIELVDELTAGQQYVLSMRYNGYHRDDMYGFYRSYYDKEGTRRYLATTQFQPTHARRAFPCFDEPGFKAKFKISIARTADRHAMSNMPVESSVYDAALGLTWDHFQETPMPISSYLIAFFVSDFEQVSSSDGFFRTWQRVSAVDQAQYSIEVTPKLLDVFNTFTEQNYFLRKLDQIAVPDFGSGAMENWGIITYRELYLLYKDGVSRSMDKQNVAAIIAHELAHKWFGNLVSPKWWRYLWLSEGFAQFFEYHVTAIVETSWRLQDQFVIQELHTALAYDSLESSHPMSVDVNTPTEIRAIFSTVSYNKAASVIRMMQHFVTHDVFQRGIANYLRIRGNSTAEPDYLFNTINQRYEQTIVNRAADVKTIMDTWSLQKGYPVVTVIRNYGLGHATISQERFLLRRDENAEPDPHDYKWWVPLSFTSENNHNFVDTMVKYWIPATQQNITITDVNATRSEWVIFNIQQTGFYRVNYDSRNWALIANYLDSDQYSNIHLINRAQIVDDALNLARAGTISYSTALNVVKYLSRELEYVPWYAALTAFSYLDKRIRGLGEYEHNIFKQYVVGLLQNVYNVLGFFEPESDSHLFKLNRNQILTWLCDYEVESCTSRARDEFRNLLENSSYYIPPDLKTVVYCNGLRYGGEQEWEFLWDRYLNENVNSEQVIILRVLGCTRNEELAHRYLRKTITPDSGIRAHDMSRVYPSVYNNPYGVDYAISFLEQNYNEILAFNNNSPSSITSLIGGIAGALSSESQLQRLNNFITTASDVLGESGVISARNNLQSAERNLAWLQNFGTSINTWIKELDYRLPKSVIPEHYEIKLISNLDDGTFKFQGQVDITVIIAEATDNIVLHVEDIEIQYSGVVLRNADDAQTVNILTHIEDGLRDFYIIGLASTLPAGQRYILSIPYEGYHREDMYGFYRSYYYDENNNTRWLASTQFQATSARRAFPCFDEPGFKAKFKISIARTADRNALSNMHVASSEPDTSLGLVWDHFEETPMPMSTYLIAFVVSDFKSLDSDDGFYRTWQREEAVDQAQYSIDISPPTMESLQNFTELEYFLPKIDQVAVPDFSAGAMENWGLVTYRERMILWKEGVSTSSNKQSIVAVIAHEFAHKWFGNLVSPVWWEHLWLNEGFARYFQYFTVAEVEPEMRMDDQFVVAQVHTALSYDSLESSHPMTVNVGSPSSVSAIFSSVSYNKAAAVIRMAEHFLGHETFRKGLVSYLTNRGNQTAVPDDLFNAWHQQYIADTPPEFVEINVKTVLDTWSLQKNYPVITVTRNYTSGDITISQERFLLRRDEDSTDTHNYRWWVPLSYTSELVLDFRTTAPRAWLSASQAEVTYPNFFNSHDNWLIFNIQQTGFYRVNYDSYNWNLLINTLNSEYFENIHVLNRAQLIDDAFTFARAGTLDYITVMRLTHYLSRETDYIPWYAALNSISYINQRLPGLGRTQYNTFRGYMIRLLRNMYNRLGREVRAEDDHVTRLHRNLILTWLCNLEESTCMEWAALEFQKLVVDPEYEIDPDVKSVVYCSGLRYGNEDDFDFMWDRFVNHNVNFEQILVLSYLGCFDNEELAHKFLRKTITPDSGIRAQDMSTVYPSVYNRPYGVKYAISFVRQNYQDILAYNNNSLSSVNSILSGISNVIATNEEYESVRNLITEISEALGVPENFNVLQSAERNLLWLNNHGSIILNEVAMANYRLPSEIVPEYYDIKLITNLDDGNFEFSGDITITVRVRGSTSTITLHANDIEIDGSLVSVVSASDGTALNIVAQEEEPQYHFYHIHLASPLTIWEQYHVTLKYKGYHREDMYGFYRSSYQHNGQTRWIATTQFQPTHARRAFPCLDEPGLKAKFKISIARSQDRHALSNMPIERTEFDPTIGLTWDHFNETSVPVSTYLIAFIVSDFESVSTSDGFFSTWQRSTATDQAAYSLDVTPKLLAAFEDYTTLNYPLPKLDQVAIPDFSAGAMENYGLITYREMFILYEEGVSRAIDKQNVGRLIAHELAHKWFGNLVSPKWWKYLWLNEGFAQFFQHFMLATVESSWRMDWQFVTVELHTALSADALESAHPMTVDVSSPSEISSIFSTISYQKAASVIRMMQHFVTHDVFQYGLAQYLRWFGNYVADPDNLFSVINLRYQEYIYNVPTDLKTIMDTWTLQKNYPVLTVTRNYDTGEVTVSQERFLLRRDDNIVDTHDYKWWVPLSYTSQSEQDFINTAAKSWIPPSETPVTISDIPAESNEWILFNIQQTGYYRVNYDANNWNLIISYLNSDQFTNIHVLNRANLIDDAMNLARAELLDYNTVMRLLSYLSRELEYIPWSAALNNLAFLNRRIRGLGEYEHYVFRSFVTELLDTAYQTLGWNELVIDQHTVKLHRNLILTWLCEFGVKSCTDRAVSEFRQLMANPNYVIAPELKSVVYCNGLRYGGTAEWEFLWNRYENHNVNTEQTVILQNLGCTRNEALAHRYLRTTITPNSGVRRHDFSRVFPSVYNQLYGVDFAISFLEQNYLEILEFNNNATSSITSLISNLCGVLSTQPQLNRLRWFVDGIQEILGPAATQAAFNSMRVAEENILFLETHGRTITTWIKTQNYRLPTTITPEYYDVKLITDLDDDMFVFKGDINILLNVNEATDRIIFHANDLFINETTVMVYQTTGGNRLEIEGQSMDFDRHFYDIKLATELVPGQQYNLTMMWEGNHREDMYGFYRSYYHNSNGQLRWLASTQFQPTHARRVFPCWDEPGFKAKFKTSVARTADRHTLSNMPVERTEADPDLGLVWDHFEETPMPISTYLIAYVVSDFEKLSSADGFYNTWQRADAVSQAQYSIDVSPPTMQSLENFTELSYFLPKVDQVAVPDFGAGAMENWGLVTYREQYLLWEPGVSTSINKQNVATIVAHEFAHKWFGNLVSPKWWKYTWLNEGFARYFEFFTTATVETTWRMDHQFVVRQVHTSLSSDSLPTAHPLTVDVGSPSSVSSIFSTITYNKGASVIRMAEHFLTHETFRKGLSRYLTAHGNITADPDELFQHLQAQYEEDFAVRPFNVKTVLDTWTLQRNHPLITVTRNYDTGAVTVTQERFLLRRDGVSTDTHTYRWWVPLTYTTQPEINFENTATRTWMTANQEQITLSDLNIARNQWVLFNIQQIGFYRVNYDTSNWNLITNYLNSGNHEDIHLLNRAQLLDDAFNLARAGTLSYRTALGVTTYLSRELDYIPWFAALTGFNYIDRRLRGISEYEHHAFQKYILHLLEGTLENLGLTERPEDDHATKLHRNLVLTWACNYGHKSCIENATQEFAILKNNPDHRVTPDLKTVVYCNGLRYGGEEEFEFLWNRYLTHNVNTEQVLILNVMGCTRNETLAHRHLRRTITQDSGIRSQDMSTVYSSVYNNPYGVNYAINFIKENYQEIIAFNDYRPTAVSSLISGIAGAISTLSQYNDLRTFILSISDELGEAATNSALNNLINAERNFAWINEYGSTVSTWVREQDYRLPLEVIPTRYEIRLKPDLDGDAFNFEGDAKITVQVIESTDRITFHADDIDIPRNDVSLTTASGTQSIPIQAQTYDDLRHFYDIKFNEELSEGEYILNLRFNGYHRDDMRGFYRSYYYNETGQKRWLASTHFQATHARRAFPCFDEPALKAVFKLSIARTPDRHSLSNMDIESQEPDSTTGLVWDHFRETPMPISTYLIAFVVSDFVSLSSTDNFFRTWQRDGLENQAVYSIEVSPPIMDVLENYTGLPYFLPKLDQIAVPDFSAGAMENWGIVTYRERNILWENGVSTSSNKQSTAAVIAHEIAHKWFGNLVSPKWWKYLWLNEGFARFFQYFTTAEVETDWRIDEQFVVAQVHSALSSDSLESSHAMSADVGSPTSVRTLFSTISYNKAASVLRMTQHFMTPELFQQGIQYYLADRGNKSAEPSDLFNALQQYAKLPVEVDRILDTWTLQKGYPLITVTRNYAERTLTVTQERFLLRKDERDLAATGIHDYKWWVPLSYTAESAYEFSNTTARTWLGNTQNRTTIAGVPANEDQWVIFNIQQTGFYRVNYDVNNWNRIIRYLKSGDYENIHVLNRAQLIDDALTLARAGILEYSIALDLTSYLEHEFDYIPWYAALNGFSYLNARMRGLGQDDYNVFQSHILKLLNNVAINLTEVESQDDSHDIRLLRNLVLTWQCNLGVQSCIDMSTNELATLIADSSYRISPDLKTVVYCNALRYGGQTEWEFLWNRFLNYDTPTEQVLILGILGCTRDETLAHRFLRETINADSYIRAQDQSTIYPSVYNNPYGIDYAINFISENYEEILAFNNNATSSITSLISGITGALSSEAQLTKLRELISNISSELGPSGTAAALNNLASAERNLAWTRQYGPAISEWLNQVSYRLPTDILPERYEIHLTPYLDDGSFTFDGRVSIRLNVQTSTSEIVLHANDMNIDEASVSVQSITTGAVIPIVEQSANQARHFYTISLGTILTAGQQYILSISYQGYLREDMNGFYRSHYIKNDTIRWLATTQFQATQARRAFPCFDEPAFKAKFKISIARTADRHALSNMPVEEFVEDASTGLVWDHFQETPMPMSTYLVAFVVSDFTNESTSDGFFSNWQREDANEQANYSLTVSPPLLDYFNDFTGLPYFLPKIDQVAIPDFSAGAMENWGLITYRERNILHVEGVSSAENKQRTADIISHELAHKWFGNLVSPRWWDVLWLNEGFARYFQYFATAQVETDWRYGEQFVVRQVHQALSSDSLESAHPMTHQVATPSEVWSMFSTISYAKGASVIRMMEHFLGHENFRDGLRRYIAEQANGTADPDDLFRALTEQYTSVVPAPDFDVKEVMDTWTLQKGYPMITVTRNYETGTVTVTQERFLLRPNEATPDEHVYRWWVPLTYTTRSEGNFASTQTREWLPSTDQTKTLTTTVNANDWFILNIQQTGFYRVNYDDNNWNLIINYLNSPNYVNIHPLNRAQILDDAFNLARADILDYMFVLRLTQYLSRELDYIPWYAALNGFTWLDNRLRGGSEYDYNDFKVHIRGLITNVLNRIGLQLRYDDDHVTKLLRNSIGTWACKVGMHECINFAKTELLLYRTNPNYRIDPDMKSVIYCNALKYGGEEEWDFLWQLYENTDVSTEESLILSILGCANDETISHRYLNKTITANSGIRRQDISVVTPAVYNDPHGINHAITYLHRHHADIADFNGGSYSSVVSLISGIAGALSSFQQAESLRQFITDNADALGPLYNNAVNSLQAAERNLLWLEVHSIPFSIWFRDQQFRLPSAIIPVNYSIALIPYFENSFSYDGEVNVTVRVVEVTNRIKIHAYDMILDYEMVTITSFETGENVNISRHTTDLVRNFYDILLDEDLEWNQHYVIYIRYRGFMRDDMFGFYRSYYHLGGQTKWIGTTQFQPTHARRAFPCFDEPSFKAQFDMAIAAPQGYHVLFNTKRIDDEIPDITSDGREWYRFETTPVMSTYLIAFVVSDYTNVSNAAGNVSTWQRMEARSQAQYSISVTQPIVTAMETLIGHNYQLNKLDQVAIPDFSAGAMENWGLVTYRERLILWDERVSTTSNKHSIATVIAHEAAHKWFGNLVTLEWWKYTWLNEGFATFFETFATALVETTWRLGELFVIYEQQDVFGMDALETSRPMVYDVNSPSEIWSVFDNINYGKAASVIRMMQHFLTTDTFYRGLHTYLADHGYHNAQPDHLFHVMQHHYEQDASEVVINVKEVMDTWVLQMGYPVVTVTRNYNTNTATVRQERFLIQRNPNSLDTHDYKWWIPLTYTSGASPNYGTTTPSVWFPPNVSEITITGIAPANQYVIFNIQETAYYRVNYDQQNWQLIISQLTGPNFQNIHVINRAQLLDDALNLARSGILPYETALDITKYLQQEHDYIPWYPTLNAFSFLNRRMRGATDEEYQLFTNYILNLIHHLYYTLGFDVRPTDDHTTKLLRTNVLTWACDLELPDCISRSREEFSRIVNSPGTYDVHPDVSSIVYCNALRYGGANEWNFLWRRYIGSNVGTEQTLILNALGCTTDESIINRYLSLSITPNSGIRSQDANTAFVSVYNNPGGLDIAFNFLTENYDSISEFYGGMNSIGNILTGIAARISTRQQADALRQFIEENEENLGTALGSSRRALETVEENLVWFDNNGAVIIDWLRNNPLTTSTTSSTPSTPSTPSGPTTTPSTASPPTTPSTPSPPTPTPPSTPETTTESGSFVSVNIFVVSFSLVLSCFFVL